MSGRNGREPQWRGDGKEIFYLGRDGTLMAVAVEAAAPRFEVGTPQALFRPRLASFERLTAVSQYAAAGDGETFVINSLTPEALSRAVTVVLNWPALLQH